MVTATMTDSVAEITRNTLFQSEEAGHPQISLIVTKRERRCKQASAGISGKVSPLKRQKTNVRRETLASINWAINRLRGQRSRCRSDLEREGFAFTALNKTLLTKVWIQLSFETPKDKVINWL